MQNSAKKLPKNTIIYIKQRRSKSHICGVFFFASATPFPLYTRPHSHIMFTMLIHMFGISVVLYHRGGGDAPYNHFAFGWLYSKKYDVLLCGVILTPYPKFRNNFARYWWPINRQLKNKTFCTNQKVINLWADFGEFLCPRPERSAWGIK